MKSKIYVNKYVMHSRRGLNSRSHLTEHEGALLMIEEDGVPGYACLHPWEELGDLSLDELLAQLREGRISRQVKCALECVNADRKAREQGVSLFDEMNVPLSHATVVGGIHKVEEAVDAGFDTVKMKMGRDNEANLSLVREVFIAFPSLKIRLDFNAVSGAGAMDYFLGECGEDLRKQLDFIEDPFLLEEPAWGTLRDKYGVKFAVDRGVGNASVEYDVSIIKPAINNIQKICDAAQMQGRYVVITSYMDHPIGQCYAAYCAGKMNELYLGVVDQRCGLMTHRLYDPTAFTEAMGEASPEWQFSKGSGLGFDDLLASLDWCTI